MKTQLFAFVEDSTADALSAALEDLGKALPTYVFSAFLLVSP